jgi:hypothetical protein
MHQPAPVNWSQNSICIRLRSVGFEQDKKTTPVAQGERLNRALATPIPQNGFNTTRITVTIMMIVGTSLIIL